MILPLKDHELFFLSKFIRFLCVVWSVLKYIKKKLGSYNRLPSRGASCKPVMQQCAGLKIYKKKSLF
jgi:hypothetical protein